MAATELLIPIGHDLGAITDRSGGRTQQVRLGREVRTLTDAEFTVWLLAHGIDDQDRPSRESVIAATTGLDLPQGASTVDRFLADGLLAELDPAAEAAASFARTHRLLPLMNGLGPDQEEPWLHRIGVTAAPVVRLPSALYDVWAWSHLAPHLWDGCHEAVEVSTLAGAQQSWELEAAELLSTLLANVHVLLSTRAAYFDQGPRA
jgi:hypothetical protein